MFRLVKKSSLVAFALFSIFIVAMTSVCTIHANLVEGTYVFVAPPMYVANALGEVFTVDINISNVQDLRVFEFKLGYNTTLLDAVGVVQGPFFPSPPRSSVERLEINETMGFVWIRISLPTSVPTIAGSGTLAAVAFSVTFAPLPPEEAYSPLALYDTLLYDGSMKAIIHDSADGLYFWSSIQADPPLEGRVLEISSKNGKIGQGGFAGDFTIGETVELGANASYNGYPVANKLVSFEVMNPENGILLAQAAFTNDEGFATINFTVPPRLESLGNWTVFVTVQLADQILWNYFTFEVVLVGPPRDPVAKFTENTETPSLYYPVYFDASTSQAGFDGGGECPITEYRWDFGDGTMINTAAPTIYHTYLHAGVYYVTLTVYAPGISPFIDPHYNNTNTSYPPERKVVLAVPVGGYSQSMEKYTGMRPMLSYFALSTMLIVSFTVLRRTRKKISTSFFSH
jgi:hypothetical protein